MKTAKFPITVTESCVSVRIRRALKNVNGRRREYFIVDYTLLGKRRQEWRADLGEAKAEASAACRKIANGEQVALELRNADRVIYLRATEALNGTNVPIDTACREYADAITALSGKGSLLEAARFYVRAHSVQLPTVPVSRAVEEMIEQARRDGKSKERIHQLESYLNRLELAFNCNVTDLNSRLVSDFIVNMTAKERTKKNCRDVLAAFFKWCVGRGYLPKDSHIMEHVPAYKNRRIGDIKIFTPEELTKLLGAADDRLLPYLAIQAFAGIRGREIQRLDWSDIDLTDGFIEVRSDAAKTDVRRLVPIKENLKSWLLPLSKASGPVCPFENLSNQITRLAAAAGVPWKKNGLRHSCISYRVAECADVPRVADESGNSVGIIRTNYLRRVKPAQAREWFSITPPPPATEPAEDQLRAAA